jgi:hypothetical protein
MGVQMPDKILETFTHYADARDCERAYAGAAHSLGLSAEFGVHVEYRPRAGWAVVLGRHNNQPMPRVGR